MARGRTWRGLAAVLVAAVAAVGLAACGGDGDDAPELPGVVETTGSFRFDPGEFTVRLDRDTSFTLRNTDGRDHNFTLTYVFTDADNFVSVDVKARGTADVTFTVKERPANETFTFYCRFHQAQGMSGKIRVR